MVVSNQTIDSKRDFATHLGILDYILINIESNLTPSCSY